MAEWYPTTGTDLENLPEAPPEAQDWAPIFGVGQALSTVSMDYKYYIAAVYYEGEWYKRTTALSAGAEP